MVKNRVSKFITVIFFLTIFSPFITFYISNNYDGVNSKNYQQINYNDETVYQALQKHTCELSKRNFIYLNNLNNLEKINYYKKQDISVRSNIKSVVCLGKIIQAQDYFNYNYIFFGTNAIFSILYISISSLLILLISYLLRLKFYQSTIALILFSFSFQINFQEYLYFSDIVSRSIPFLIFYVFIDNSLKKKSKKLFSYNKNLIDSLDSKKITLPMENFVSYIVLAVLSVIYYLSGEKIIADNYLFNDVATNLLTAEKMNNFNMTNFQATWNHHSSIIPDLYSLNNLFLTENSINGLFLIHSLLIFSVSILFYHLFLKLDFSKWSSIFFVSIFLLEHSSYALKNRQLGTYINIAILYFAISYLQNNKNVYLFFYTFFSCLQFYNLESYSISILSIFLLILIFEQKRSEFFIKTFLFISASLLIIYLPIYLRGDLETLIRTNYQFHLFNTNTAGSSDTNRFLQIFEALNYPGNRGLNQYFLLNVFSLIYILSHFKNRFKNKNFDSLAVFVLYLGELVHIYITGPRFAHYGILLLLPSFLTFSIFIKYSFKHFIYLEKKKIAVNLIILILFLSPTTNIFIKERIFQKNFYPTPLTVVNEELSNNSQKNDIHNIIKSEESAELILTWIHPMDWYWVHFESNTLPASRYWIWFRMRYVDIDRYTWSGFDEGEMIEQFYRDIEKEKPEFALIDNTYFELPFFFKELLNKKFIKIYEDDKYSLYKISL